MLSAPLVMQALEERQRQFRAAGGEAAPPKLSSQQLYNAVNSQVRALSCARKGRSREGSACAIVPILRMPPLLLSPRLAPMLSKHCLC